MKGFTLIELLAAMIVFGAVGTIIAAILFSSFRGAGKTSTLTIVRQNGNYVISQVAKTLRNAQSFKGVSTNGTDYVVDCSGSTHYSSVKIADSDGTNVVFACQQPTIAANGVSLFDSSVALVDGTCFFTCQQTSLFNGATIGIFFSLQQAGAASFVDTSATIPFQTSVTLRNSPR